MFGGALLAPTGAAATAGTHNITQGTLAVTNANYNLTGYSNGTLTVNQAPLTVTADDKSKVQGSANPPFTATYSGFVYTDTAAVLGGTLSFTTPATVASPAGVYAITPSDHVSANYAISYVNGNLTITPLASVPTPPAPSSTADVFSNHRYDGRLVDTMGDFIGVNLINRPDRALHTFARNPQLLDVASGAVALDEGVTPVVMDKGTATPEEGGASQ